MLANKPQQPTRRRRRAAERQRRWTDETMDPFLYALWAACIACLVNLVDWIAIRRRPRRIQNGWALTALAVAVSLSALLHLLDVMPARAFMLLIALFTCVQQVASVAMRHAHPSQTAHSLAPSNKA